MKRFYKSATIFGDIDKGFVIRLDGKEIKTPAGNIMLVPSKEIAEEVAQEWNSQKDNIVPDDMPCTQIVTTALDRVSGKAAEMKKEILSYVNTDLVCYRTELPADLAERQASEWDKWLEWFERKYGEKLDTTLEIKALSQPYTVFEKISNVLKDMDDLRFSIFQIVTSLSGSIVLALAFDDGEAGPEDVFSAMYVEENYKVEIYKEDIHGRAPNEEIKQSKVMEELKSAGKFINMLGC
jgi:chaperone required for assembly of F1-ATPase